MFRNNRIFLLLVIQFLFPVSIFGQIKSTSLARNKNTDLAFTSSVKVSLQGTEVSNEFKLVDDLGFEYDIMSVLKNQNIRDEIAVTEDQLAAMKSIQQQMTAELLPQTVAGATSKDIGRKLEAQVKATELLLQNNLSEQQITRLEQIKNQIRFDRFGAAALATSGYLEKDLNLPTELAKSIRSKVETLKTKHSQEISQLYRQAHQKIFAELPGRKKSKLESLTSDEFQEKWISQPLFREKPKRRYRSFPTAVSFLQLLSDKEVRDAIEMVDSQFADVMKLKQEFDKKLEAQSNELLAGPGKQLSISQRGKQLAKLNVENKKEFEVKLRESLLDHQVDQLVEIAIEIEVKNAGTIQCICNGTISERIDLKEAEAKKIYSLATDLHKELQTKVKRLESNLNDQVVKLLPNFDQAQRLGPPVGFKLR